MSEFSDNPYGDDTSDSSEDSDSEKDLSGDEDTSKSTDKRISDLQSKADKETARANKAETRLKALEAALKEGDTKDSKPEAETAGNGVNDAVLDMARMFVFQQNPKLAQYGISSSDLAGSTPAAVAQSATELVARFEKIETQVRNKVLADQGLAPELDSGVPEPARDFTKMSSEDFEKVMNAALGKR